MHSTIPQVISEKSQLPTLWLDTSVGIKLAKLGRGEALQEIEVERGNRLRAVILELTERSKLLCPEADQEEEYQAERLDKEIAAEFSRLSLGVRLRHRAGILDSQIYYAMKAYCQKEPRIELPLSIYFHQNPLRQMEETLERGLIFDVNLWQDPELLARRASAKEESFEQIRKLREELVAKGQTYEAQLALEQQSSADSMVLLLENYALKLGKGIPDFWDVMSVTGVGLYLTLWKRLGGQPP